MKLNDAKIKALKPKDKPYKEFDGGGLHLLIHPNGSKYWRMKYRYNQKENQMALGAYPAISLKDARSKREAVKELLAQNINPKEYNRLLDAKNSAPTQFESLANDWMETKRDWAEQTRKDRTGAFKNHIFPYIGHLNIDDIDRIHLINIIDRMTSRNMHSNTISEIHNQIVAVYKYAIAKGLCERNLANDLKPLLPKGDPVEHRKALDREQIPSFLQKLENYGGAFVTISALKLLILTGARPGEVFGAVWTEFDIENAVWIRSEERMKKRIEHPTPLSKQAIEVLEGLHQLTGRRKHLFPNQQDPRKHMSENTLNQAIKKRMGFDATAHGMRSVFSTLMNEFGYNPDAIEMHLSHQEKNAVRRAYNRSKYWDERVIMAQQWADYLDSLRRTGKVIPFKKAL